MRRLCNRKNIFVSNTYLTLGLRVGFISSHLTADKLISVNPRVTTGPSKMNLLLEAKIMSALFKPRLILVAYTDALFFGQNVQPAATNAHSKPLLDCQQTKCYARDDPALYNKLYSNYSLFCNNFSNFPTNTQVWNILSHRNDCRQRVGI